MLDTVQSSEHHQDDESLPKSPLLEARIAKAPQSATPPRSAELDRTPSKRRTSISQPSPPAFNTQVPAETYRPSSSNPPSHADSTLSDPFCCPLCPSKFGGIYRQGNYGRHRRYKHGDSPRVIHCEHPGCSKQFNRTDARRKHYRSHHPELLHGSEYETLVDDAETAPRDLPVKTERIITRNTARNQALQINAAVIEDLWKDVNHLRIHDNVADANPVLHLPSLTPPHKDPLRALDPRPLEFEVDRSVKRQLESKNESQQPCNTTTSVHNQPPEKPGEYVQRNPNLPHSVSTPPREIQTEYPARGGQVYVHDSTKAKRRRSAYYGKSYNDRHAKAREHERVEAEANDKADARARREALRREAEKAEARYQAEQERKRQNRRPIVYQPAFDSGSESYSEGVEVPEARKPSRRRFADKGNREHRDHVVQKARQDETTAIEYTNPQRDTDVPLDDSIPRALERAPRRQSAVDLGEKEKHMLDENKEEELQFRAQALYNHPRSGPVQGGRPSYKSYLARSEAARSDPRYYVASHYSRWAARRGQPQSVTQPRLPPYKQLQNEAYESYSESETSSSDDEVSEAYRPPVVPVQRDKKQPVSAPGRLLTRFRGESLASDRTAMATKSSSQLSPTECTTSNTGTFTQLVKNTKDLQLGDIAVQSSSQAYDKQLLSKISGPDIPTRTTASSISSASTHDPSLKLSDQIKPLTVPTMSPSYNGWHDPGFNSADLPRAYYSSISTLDPLDETSSQYRGRYDYSIFSGPEATIDSDIELVSPVLMNPVSKDFQNAQKTNNSELKVEEEETKQMLSAGSEEVLQKSREVQMDAPVGSSDSNESLAMDVEEYSDANPKHQGSVADLKRSTSTLALENSTTDVQMDDTILSGRESDLPILEYDPVDVWLGAGSINIPESYHRSGYESTPSGSSSYAASVASDFSVTSLASSASDISKGSGYSPVQIATATKVLLSVFYEDKTLLSLYKSAMGNEDIGPERLHRNLRRLFRAYAGLLENEATERLEYLSSRLVLIKSAFLAQSIVEKLQNGRVGAQSPRSKRNEESSDEEDDSSDTHLVNEDAFEDLAIFREFLVESDAFRTFCDRLEAFILPKSTYLTHEELTSKGETLKATMMKPASTETVSGHGDVLTWQKWRRDAKLSTDGLFHGAYLETTATSLFHLMMDAIFLATDDLLIAAGRLEPPLSPNMVRLRWQCACGDSLHSDVSELRKGGIEELISHMQRTSGAKVVASPHSHQSGNQKYVMPNPTQWIQKAFTSIFGGSAKKSAACLPQHNTPCTSTTTANALPPQRSILHLLACMHRNRLRKDLKQDRIEDITTDRALLCFLRKQYRLHRGRFLHALSLQSVKGISFVKFRLPIGGSVDVRHHDPCCVADTTGPKTCECIPPPPKVEPSPGAEYRCIPGPPATYPPIPPVYLASLFTCPTDVHEKDTWILDQLPKRTCGELKGQIGQPAEGWGIYYDEGLDGDMLAWTILIVFLVASLLFGVLWSKFQYDIQGAFGVSAYMVACCAAVLPVIVTKLGNKG